MKKYKYTLIVIIGWLLDTLCGLPTIGFILIFWGIFGDISTNLTIQKISNITTKKVDFLKNSK